MSVKLDEITEIIKLRGSEANGSVEMTNEYIVESLLFALGYNKRVNTGVKRLFNNSVDWEIRYITGNRITVKTFPLDHVFSDNVKEECEDAFKYTLENKFRTLIITNGKIVYVYTNFENKGELKLAGEIDITQEIMGQTDLRLLVAISETGYDFTTIDKIISSRMVSAEKVKDTLVIHIDEMSKLIAEEIGTSDISAVKMYISQLLESTSENKTENTDSDEGSVLARYKAEIAELKNSMNNTESSCENEEAYKDKIRELTDKLASKEEEIDNLTNEVENLKAEISKLDNSGRSQAKYLLDLVQINDSEKRQYVGVINQELFTKKSLSAFVGTALQKLYELKHNDAYQYIFDGEMFTLVRPAVRNELMVGNSVYDIDVENESEDTILSKLVITFSKFSDVVFEYKKVGTLAEGSEQVEEESFSLGEVEPEPEVEAESEEEEENEFSLGEEEAETEDENEFSLGETEASDEEENTSEEETETDVEDEFSLGETNDSEEENEFSLGEADDSEEEASNDLLTDDTDNEILEETSEENNEVNLVYDDETVEAEAQPDTDADGIEVTDTDAELLDDDDSEILDDDAEIIEEESELLDDDAEIVEEASDEILDDNIEVEDNSSDFDDSDEQDDIIDLNSKFNVHTSTEETHENELFVTQLLNYTNITCDERFNVEKVAYIGTDYVTFKITGSECMDRLANSINAIISIELMRLHKDIIKNLKRTRLHQNINKIKLMNDREGLVEINGTSMGIDVIDSEKEVIEILNDVCSELRVDTSDIFVYFRGTLDCNEETKTELRENFGFNEHEIVTSESDAAKNLLSTSLDELNNNESAVYITGKIINNIIIDKEIASKVFGYVLGNIAGIQAKTGNEQWSSMIKSEDDYVQTYKMIIEAAKKCGVTMRLSSATTVDDNYKILSKDTADVTDDYYTINVDDDTYYLSKVDNSEIIIDIIKEFAYTFNSTSIAVRCGISLSRLQELNENLMFSNPAYEASARSIINSLTAVIE